MKRFVTIAAVLALTFGVAACSSGEDEAPADTAATEATSAPAASGGEVAGGVVPPAEPAAGEETPVVASTGSAPEPAAPANPADLFVDPENIIYMELKCGRVVIQMRPDLAPQTVAQIKTLTRQGFYDGLTFHRVISGFMAQTGDPLGTGYGRSEMPNVPAEFSNEPFVRGAVGMARGTDPNSGNSQFFIMFTRYPTLDGQYTLWGEVTEGMDCIDQINRGEPPANPDTIYSMRVAADVQ